ncbi:MAG TPA: amino acid adenylation domain-containing protein, partial [Aquella sp.]|nr:amino acid adenylation domain-containing protein [Aquella sp.]
MIGFFVNSLVLRSKVDKDNVLIDYIKMVSAEIVEAQLHQDVPFEKLVNELNISQDTSRHPIFQVMFIVQHFESTVSKYFQLFKLYQKYEYKVAKFDITAIIDDSQTILKGIFNYATNLFSKETILQMIKTFEHILEQIAELNENSTAKIKNISYLNKEDYQKVIYDWNKTEKKYPDNKTIHELFEEQVAKTPDNIAVIYEDTKLTYKELNERSNQLANYLRETYQIKGDDLIALCLNRSEYILITILGVLKSGAAYVPIAPDFPIERISYILQDTQAKVLITDSMCHSSIGDNLYPNILILDRKEFAPVLKKYAASNLKSNITSKNLAYIIYTSGTTGNPKGVMIEHLGIVNILVSLSTKYAIKQIERILLFANYNFDASIEQIFLALINGGILVVPGRDDIVDPQRLSNLIKKNQVTHVHATPEYLKLLNNLKTYRLNRLISGGDYLTAQLYNKLASDINVVVNEYGPTEATITSLVSINKFGIGKPVSNTKVYVLDNNVSPLPIGGIGELYIGGDGLARGYLNQSLLTKEHFIVNPFQTKKERLQNKNNKLYKTGDLVRYLSDGDLEYIGRNDFQVKIRGYRIELGEIENAINHYPGIKQSVVLVNEMNNSKYLVAYYVADYELDETLLSAYLVTKLPEYMLPAAYTYIGSIPLTINGKLDKQSLPSPLRILKNDYLAPRNAAEIKICTTYSKVLSLPLGQIGINHDFFRLGGNSILAIKLLYTLQQEFKINLNDIFNLRTPAGLAQLEISTKNSLYYKLKQMKSVYDRLSSYENVVDPIMQIKQIIYLQEGKEIKFVNKLKNINNVLLTGGTGYLGCHILYQLLYETKYKIYLLTRAKSNVEAYNRINRKFKYYFDTGLDDFLNRIVAIASDVEKPNLNLGKKQFQDLIDNVDSIIHSAALVKHYGDYATFYQANVQATINLLELAKQTNLKDFHYISTLSVLENSYIPNYNYYVFTEDDNDIGLKYNNNVYVQTKYEGELATIRYREFGVNSNIYRVGNLVMSSKNYRVQENVEENAFFTRVKTILKLGMIPKEISKVEISPVDYTALAITKLFNQKELSNKIYHVTNPHICDLSELLAANVKAVTFERFINTILIRLNNMVDREQIERFMLHQMWLEDINLLQLTKVTILQNKTDIILCKLGFRWPSITSKMISDIITKSFLGDKKMKKKEPIFEYLESIAELIPAPFWWSDVEGRIMGLNTLSLQGTGASDKADIVGKTLYEIYKDIHIADKLQNEIQIVIHTGKSTQTEDVTADVITGKLKYYSATRAPLRNKKNEIIGIVGTSIEITAQKEAEKLRHENRKLEAQNKLNQVMLEKEAAEAERLRLENELHKLEKDKHKAESERLQLENALQKLENDKHQAAAEEQEKFKKIVGQVVHDIQSPLASLRGIVEDMAGSIPEEKRITLRQASMRISDIAQNMLVRYKNKAEDNELSEPLLVSTALLEVLSEKRFEHKSVLIDTDFKPESHFAFIQIEPGQFKRMISNVINNAVHALGNKEDGLIKVELGVNREWVFVFIEDNGCGMSQDLIDKIEKNIGITSGKKDGSGIGLTQVQETLQRNYGQLTINSEEGEYTEVMLKFPKIMSPFWIAEEIKVIKDDTIVILDDD